MATLAVAAILDTVLGPYSPEIIRESVIVTDFVIYRALFELLKGGDKEPLLHAQPGYKYLTWHEVPVICLDDCPPGLAYLMNAEKYMAEFGAKA